MLSQTSEYALRAMACLALSPGVLTATPILANQTKVPTNYLAKVLQQLAAAELIEGRRGVGGGYKLSRPAAQISLMEVVNAVADVKRIETCPLGITNHGAVLCPLHRKMDQAVAAVMQVFGSTTLQHLIDDPKSRTPLCETESSARLTVKGG